MLTSGDGECRSTLTEIDGCGGRRGDFRAAGCAIAQLSVPIKAPALHGTVVENSAGVVFTTGHGQDGSARSYINKSRRRCINFVRIVSDLTAIVLTPAHQRPVVKNGARMVGTAGHCNNAAA